MNLLHVECISENLAIWDWKYLHNATKIGWILSVKKKWYFPTAKDVLAVHHADDCADAETPNFSLDTTKYIVERHVSKNGGPLCGI